MDNGELGKLVAVLLLAVFTEGFVEYTISGWLGKDEVEEKPVWKTMVPRYAALVIGIVMALVFNVDFFGIVGLDAVVPYAGCVATGVIIGRGSNYASDLLGKFTGK